VAEEATAEEAAAEGSAGGVEVGAVEVAAEPATGGGVAPGDRDAAEGPELSGAHELSPRATAIDADKNKRWRLSMLPPICNAR
jgi:hypothetical protein